MTRTADTERLSFEEVLRALLKQVVAADAEMQLQQGLAWKQVTAPLRVRGIDVAEGLEHFRALGITELRLEFRLEPRMPGRCARIWRARRYLVGMPGAMQPMRYRLAATNSGTCAIGVTVTVGRTADGAWDVTSESAEGAPFVRADVPRALAEGVALLRQRPALALLCGHAVRL